MNVLTYLLIGALVLILLGVANWYLRRPPRYRKNVNDDLSKFFKALLDETTQQDFSSLRRQTRIDSYSLRRIRKVERREFNSTFHLPRGLRATMKN
jgi:hypothetical protein